MKGKLSPSMMCADVMRLKDVLETFKKNDIEYLHIDVMAGVFAPNYMLGVEFCKTLKANCDIPLDFHLMIENPDNKLDWFPIQKGDVVSVHAESTYHLHRVISKIKSLGAKPFVALNPATPISCLEYLLDDIDGVMLMTVNPGYAGQKLIPSMIEKIKETRKFLDDKGKHVIEIEVDGNVSFENLSSMRSAGANIFVSGSSGVFTKSMTLEQAIKQTRELI
jgi:ribulose-phosphate 3-epimerase